MVVKKYSNRRLYDTDESRYVTLDEVAAKIRGGEDLRMVDVPSGEDITQAMLAQIILESRGASRLLPVPLLYQLVRMGDDALAEFFGRYVAWALEVYLRARQGAKAMAPYAPAAQLPLAAGEALARLLASVAGWGGAQRPTAPWGPPPDEAAWAVAEPRAAYPEPPRPEAPPEPPPPPAAAAPTREDVDALRRELDALKAALLARQDDDKG